MITRMPLIKITLTPYELAKEFCDMDGEKQAQFFNSIGLLVEEWDKPFPFQLQAVSDSPLLREYGKIVMQQIGECGWTFGPERNLQL